MEHNELYLDSPLDDTCIVCKCKLNPAEADDGQLCMDCEEAGHEQ